MVGRRFDRPRRADATEGAAQHGRGVGVVRQGRGPGSGAYGFRAARARDRDDVRSEVEQPGERDLGGGGAEALRGVGQRAVAIGEAGGAARSSERGVRDHGDAELRAALDDPAAERTVVVEAQRDLDRRDRHQLDRLVELAAIDVRHADALDHVLVEQAA